MRKFWLAMVLLLTGCAAMPVSTNHPKPGPVCVNATGAAGLHFRQVCCWQLPDGSAQCRYED